MEVSHTGLSLAKAQSHMELSLETARRRDLELVAHRFPNPFPKVASESGHKAISCGDYGNGRRIW